MIARHKKIQDVPTLNVRNKPIGLVHSYEYLDIILDDQLSHNEYFDSIWKKTNNKIRI